MSSSLPKYLDVNFGRPSSVPPSKPAGIHTRVVSNPYLSRPSSSHGIREPPPSPPGTTAPSPLDNTALLLRATPGVVKTRTGSVLSRSFILKTDHWPTGRAQDLDLDLHGAPNFRGPRQQSLNVFGVAQPRVVGLKTILSLLNCRSSQNSSSRCVWVSTREEPIVYISGRPFVLRDAAEPRRTLSMSYRAENLEAVENRLKMDILAEAAKYGGLILTHNEIAEGDGNIIPTWTAVDENSVKTSREVWQAVSEEGWNVEYHRIPISPDRPIEDNYLDAYVRVIKAADPLRTSLVFSCGMGAVRTTFAMVAACLLRRKQFIERGLGDPFPKNGPSATGTSTPAGIQAALALEQAIVQQELSKSLLRLTYMFQQTLQGDNTQSAVELLLMQPSLMENLRKAHMGNYSVILSLLGCVDNGLQTKKLVDRIVDSCDHVVNLREEVLVHRVKYSVTRMDDNKREVYLERATKALEKYFFMIAFASYVEEQTDFSETFSQWMKTRVEIWNQVKFLRKSSSRLNVFAPVNDLSSISKSGAEARSLEAGRAHDVTVAGGKVLGDEWTEHVIKNRSGIILRTSTLLKSDQWRREQDVTSNGVRGTSHFRNIPGTNIYALGQPTVDAIDEVVARVKKAHPAADHIAWINLREEPIVMVNGAPYCLRRENYSLRNMKDYGGISASRLETLEDRLKSDILAELQAFGGRLLLHTEDTDGTVVPIWEEVKDENVAVLKEVFATKRSEVGIDLHYSRIPITSERPPDFHDISDLLDVVIRTHSANTPIILNCQLGRGRSTITSIVVLLIQRWLQSNQQRPPRTPAREMSFWRDPSPMITTIGNTRVSYQIINNLLRVIRNGLQVKEDVEKAIDACSEVFDLRQSIEDSRIRAEEASDDRAKRLEIQRGVSDLRKYFQLIIFQAYLQSTPAGTMRDFESFEKFVKDRPVFKTFENELVAGGADALKPLERVDVADGMAHPDEVKKIVANRSGSILSASTILKSDFFSNLQKMSLPERIEGAPNFRRVPLTLSFRPDVEGNFGFRDDGMKVCGSGMPTVQGLRRALARVDASPQGSNKVWWTSLREEPVLYVAGRPHVLRLVDRPLQNVEATGITTDVVEAMEINLKRDVQREVRNGNGRILLHDEVEDAPGVFTITPQWETVSVEDIMTPKDVFDLMIAEGYQVNYSRVAITDEQAPLPNALSQIFERVRAGLEEAGDLIFNCQMGRGRTTSGMVAACLVSTALSGEDLEASEKEIESPGLGYDNVDGVSEEAAYLNGEYKNILQLVGLLSYGKTAKRLCDRAIDTMADVQNLRRAIFDYKLKVDATDPITTPAKHRKLMDMGVAYLYRYATLIVFANYLIEMTKGTGPAKDMAFPVWLKEHREISKLLGRRSLD